jgi:hypothetical protein
MYALVDRPLVAHEPRLLAESAMLDVNVRYIGTVPTSSHSCITALFVRDQLKLAECNDGSLLS